MTGKPQTTGKTLDLKQELRDLYQPHPRAARLVDVPSFNYLQIDGVGDPNTAPAYPEALAALYPLAYRLKFAVKARDGIEYSVMPLEGLWWLRDGVPFDFRVKDNWQWTMMILQPAMVTADLVAAKMVEVARTKHPAALSRVRFAPYDEGLAAQILHRGPYATEAPTIALLHDFIQAEGYTLRGKHHEIYLSDPNRTAPEKLRTILRQPVERR